MEYLLKEPFIIGIAAPRKSGKSFFIRTLLKHAFLDHFDEIHIMSLSVKINEDYREFATHKHVKLYDEFRDDTIKEIIDRHYRLAVRIEDEAYQQKTKPKKRKRKHSIQKEDTYERRFLVSPMHSGVPSKKKRRRELGDQHVVFQLDSVRGKVLHTRNPEIPFNVLIAESDSLKEQNHEFENPDMEELPKEVPKILFIFDDCVDSDVLLPGQSLDMTAMRGRHMNISVVVSSQRIAPISINVRDNCDLFCIFAPFTIQETESFIERFVTKTNVKYARTMLETVFEKKYQFLYVDGYEDDRQKRFKISNASDFISGKYTVFEVNKVHDLDRKAYERLLQTPKKVPDVDQEVDSE